jgi:periodic tryptophan protein 2
MDIYIYIYIYICIYIYIGKAVLSCSLDGTVRAHDLLRYRNFRTLTTPTPVQLISLAVDSSGEIVCAGSLDPFDIYVWSLQTGRLLDILSGHEGPIACLDFSLTSSTLASGIYMYIYVYMYLYVYI